MLAIVLITIGFVVMLGVGQSVATFRRWDGREFLGFHLLAVLGWGLVLFFVFASCAMSFAGSDEANADYTEIKKVAAVSSEGEIVTVSTEDGDEVMMAGKRFKMSFDEQAKETVLVIHHRHSDDWACDTSAYELVMGGGSNE